jgi:hypothetical protein
MGQLGGAFASGFGESINGQSRSLALSFAPSIDLGAALKSGWEKAAKLLSSLRGPDFIIATLMVGVGNIGVGTSRALAYGDSLADVPVIGSLVGTGAELSFAFGWMLQLSAPSRREIRSWLSGQSFTVSAFYKLGGGIVRVPGGNPEYGVIGGFGIGGKGASAGYGFTPRW